MGALSWNNFGCNQIGQWVKLLARGTHASEFLACLWGVWKWRNNMCFEEVPWSVEEAWRRIRYDHDEFKLVLSGASLGAGGGLLVSRWTPQRVGEVKVNTDGSFGDVTRKMSWGGVIRDHEGSWLGGFAGSGPEGNALLAEAFAVRDGLALVWSRGYRKVHCETDCLELINLLQNVTAPSFLPVLEEINQLLSYDWEVALKHIPRNCNTVADHIAKMAASPDAILGPVLDPPPVDLEHLLLRDSLFVV